MHLAESFRAAGRNTEASAAFESAFARLTAMGRDRTEMAGTLLNNWGLSRYLLGQPREAERLFRRAVEIGSADAAGASVSPMLLNNLARPVLEQGRVGEALAIAERAAAEADAARQRRGRAVQSMLLRATAYRELGDLDARRRAAGRVRAAADRPPAAGARRLLGAGVRTGAARRSARRPRRGRPLRRTAPWRLPRPARRGASCWRAACCGGRTWRCARGRVAEALADAERGLALEVARGEAGSLSSILGRAHLTMGQAFHAAARDRRGPRVVVRGGAPPRVLARRRPPRHPPARDLLASLE